MTDVTTVGNLLVNDALPEDMRKAQHVLDKKGAHKLFLELYEKHPDKYVEVLEKLSNVGRETGWTEGISVSLSGLLESKKKKELVAALRPRINAIIDDDSLDADTRKKMIVDELLKAAPQITDEVVKEATDENNPFAVQMASGGRGKKSDINSLRGADLLVMDQNDEFLPVPLWNGFGQGLSPAEAFAASYGQRKGMLTVKLGVGQAGYYGKRLANAAHRIVITRDKPDPTRLPVGLPTTTSDKENIGAVLAHPVGKLPAGHMLSSRDLDDLQEDGIEDILVHSPLTEPSPDGGISAWAAGRRIRNGLHQIGDNVGLLSAQSVSEKLSQATLGAKHAGGIKDKVSRSGYDYLNRLLEAPESFPEAAPLAAEDGVVKDIKAAPQGGNYVYVNGAEHYVPKGIDVTVKIGDQVEAGDDLTDGIAHPDDLIKYRGIGEARRLYTKYMKEALEETGVASNRRNIETIVSGLINWADVTDPDGIGDSIYGDTVPFNRLTYNYKPRAEAAEADVHSSVGKYLEEPVLHYTPGTRITKRVAKDLDKWGIKKAFSHAEPPPFQPRVIRGIQSTYYDPDWQVRLSGFYTGRAFSDALHRGAESDTQSTSYVPALANPVNFGKNLATQGKYGSVIAKLASGLSLKAP